VITADLPAGSTVMHQVTATVPFGIQGAYNVFLKVDRDNVVTETTKADNLVKTPIQILYAPPPADLVVDTITVPATALTGQSISVAWRVKNQGSGQTNVATWSDRVYLSANGVLDSNSIVLGTFSHTGVLSSADSYGQVQSLTLPVDLAAGSYTVFVSTDFFN